MWVGVARESPSALVPTFGCVSGAIRHHYVPVFLQRRFALRPADPKAMLVRLDVSSGRCRTANPLNEAVRRRYYRMEDEEGNVDDGAEAVLSAIESRAAEVITGIVDDPTRPPGPEGMVGLAQFVATLANRTPDARADLAAMDVEIAKLDAELRLSDLDAVRRAVGPDATRAEALEQQAQWLEDINSGKLFFESTPTREVGLMLEGMLAVAPWLFEKALWTVLIAPEDHAFVLSDAPVAHYDPTPKVEGAGAGFASSPGSMTIVPVDSRMALLITPSPDGLWSWYHRHVDADLVDDVNLLIYAQADEAIFARSQELATKVRRQAKANPRRVGRYARRRPMLWVTETGPTDPLDARPRTFVGRNRDRTITRLLSYDGPHRRP